jgi:hypothetical protein
MGARGERTIQFDGRAVTILFTNRALMSAEKQLGKGIIAILNEFNSGGGVGDLVALLRAGMDAARIDARSGGKSISNDDALQVIDEIGFAAAATSVMEAIADVISYSAKEGEEPQNGSDPN